MSVVAPYRGACACGEVTATIAGEPIATRQCWCRQCQQAAGGGPATNAIFRTDDIALSGALASNGYVAASGNGYTQCYCPACGTPVMAQIAERPQIRVIRFGFLAPGHGLAPQAVIWTSEAPEWAVLDPALPHHPEGAPPPPPAG